LPNYDVSPDGQHFLMLRAIEQAQARGMRVYDFLAGEAPYKARLGRRLGELVWCRGQRDRPLLRCERLARRLISGLGR
jgi:CelD/BcsL family acetyltransferase involved in cellulose biosynthesis